MLQIQEKLNMIKVLDLIKSLHKLRQKKYIQWGISFCLSFCLLFYIIFRGINDPSFVETYIKNNI